MATKIIRVGNGAVGVGRFVRRALSSIEVRRHSSVAVDANEPEVQELLDSLAIVDVSKVFKAKVEPLNVPYYKLLTLEELEKVQKDAHDKARKLLKTPPILPVREPRGHVIEVDENLSGVTKQKIIFTETTQHKDNKLRTIVVREPDGVLRDATWDERDRMCQIFFPSHGRKMWLPEVLTDSGLTPVLKKQLHVDILDLVTVQCDAQAPDYHRVYRRVFEDIVRQGCYELLYSTRYFGCLVWYLLTASQPPRILPLLQDLVKQEMQGMASEIVKLFMMCYPDDELTVKLRTAEDDLVEGFLRHSNIQDKTEEDKSEESTATN